MSKGRRRGDGMIGIKVMFLGSILTLAGLAQADTLQAGKALGSMPAPMVLGVVCVGLAVAVIMMWSYSKERNDRLEQLITNNVAATQRQSDTNIELGKHMERQNESQHRVATALEKMLENCKTHTKFLEHMQRT